MASVARALFQRCLVVAAVVPCAPVEAASETGEATQLPSGPRLEWSDPEQLLPFGLDRVADELAAMGRVMGADLRLVPAGAVERPGRHDFRVDVMRRPKPYWHLRGDVMAAAPRVEGSLGTIYLFLDQVRTVLGHLASRDPSAAPRQHAELARAVARILAHEVVHLVAPDHPHSTSGLMVARLRRAPLLRRQARIDPVCARAFRRALGMDGLGAVPAGRR